MTLSEELLELKEGIGAAPTAEQLVRLFDLTARMAERLSVLEDLASERQIDCEELFARCDGMEDDLRELAGLEGYSFEDELTADELDEAVSEVQCEGCGAVLLARGDLAGDEAQCPCCGEPLPLNDHESD